MTRAMLLSCLISGSPLGAADHREAWIDLRDIQGSFLSQPDLLSPQAPDLTLVWFDPQDALPQGFETMAREVQAIFGALDVRVAWRRGGLGTTFGGVHTPELAVILLAADPLPERQKRRVMGLVLKNQEPNRSIWVFLSNVRWTLGLPPPPGGPLAEEEGRKLGLALGRVVAHEVVHAVAPDEPHAAGGLMEHSLGRTYLLGRRVAFDPRCARAFLASLGARPAPSAGSVLAGP